MTVHTGQKPFVCTEPGCTKSFNYPGQLSAHIKSAHKSEQALKGMVDINYTIISFQRSKIIIIIFFFLDFNNQILRTRTNSYL